VRLHQLSIAIGQRFVHRQVGRPDSVWTVTRIEPPLTLTKQEKVELTEDITNTRFERTYPALAQALVDGVLRATDPSTKGASDNQTSVATSTSALSNLLAEMSPKQLVRFKSRAAYVQLMYRGEAGYSHKSETFKLRVRAIFLARRDAWANLKVRNEKEALDNPIEACQPSPYSVYRWCLCVRKAHGDLSVLAKEVLGTKTRRPRKPKVRELMDAFLANRKAEIASTSVASLTSDFNRLLQTTNPLHFDKVIDDLRRDQEKKAELNAHRRRRRPNITKQRRK
jgi:hypothetical protein